MKSKSYSSVWVINIHSYVRTMKIIFLFYLFSFFWCEQKHLWEIPKEKNWKVVNFLRLLFLFYALWMRVREFFCSNKYIYFWGNERRKYFSLCHYTLHIAFFRVSLYKQTIYVMGFCSELHFQWKGTEIEWDVWHIFHASLWLQNNNENNNDDDNNKQQMKAFHILFLLFYPPLLVFMHCSKK